jgi:hypothetical protein
VAAGFRVQVGVTRPNKRRPTPQGFHMRLTKTQTAALFPGLTKLPRNVWPRARCGLAGCAYPRSEHEVVKFTNDGHEAYVASLLRKSPIPGTLPVLDVRRIRRRPGEKPVFAIVAKRLPAPKGLSRALAACPGPFVEFSQGRDAREGLPRLAACTLENARDLGVRADFDEVRSFVSHFVDTVSELQSHGVLWTDLHRGNVTEDERGRPVILDIGPFSVDDEVDGELESVPLLAGRL